MDVRRVWVVRISLQSMNILVRPSVSEVLSPRRECNFTCTTEVSFLNMDLSPTIDSRDFPSEPSLVSPDSPAQTNPAAPV